MVPPSAALRPLLAPAVVCMSRRPLRRLRAPFLVLLPVELSHRRSADRVRHPYLFKPFNLIILFLLFYLVILPLNQIIKPFNQFFNLLPFNQII